VPAPSLAEDVAHAANGQITKLLLGEIGRCHREIRELQDEADALNRMLQKIRADRGAIV
jgi:hypothetical protein